MNKGKYVVCWHDDDGNTEFNNSMAGRPFEYETAEKALAAAMGGIKTGMTGFYIMRMVVFEEATP